MIGWYVHHQGSGHLQRLQSIATHLRTPVAGLSTLPAPDGWNGPWVQLPSDAPRGDERDPTAGGTLHWAPLFHDGLRKRMAAVASWCSAARPRLVVVDVSVEVAVLVRSLGVPVVVAAMRGERGDRAHRTAYDLAHALLAPWPASRPEPWPAAWRAKAWHVGALSRYDGRAGQPAPRRQQVVVLWGSGGGEVRLADVRAAEEATPGWTWTSVGVPGSPWVPDVWAQLQRADVVVTHGGQNAVAEVAAARRPAVILPQPRPHGEQLATARALDRAGMAVVRQQWPAPSRWPDLLAQASRLDPERWQEWSDGNGASRAAALLDEAVACARR